MAKRRAPKIKITKLLAGENKGWYKVSLSGQLYSYTHTRKQAQQQVKIIKRALKKGRTISSLVM